MSRPRGIWTQPSPPPPPRRRRRAGAAVADWSVEPATHKLKKADGPPELHWIAQSGHPQGPRQFTPTPGLLIGFAAQTEDVAAQARAKRERKGADWIVANDVSGDVMGGDANTVHLITADGEESWARASKQEVARRLAQRIADAL